MTNNGTLQANGGTGALASTTLINTKAGDGGAGSIRYNSLRAT